MKAVATANKMSISDTIVELIFRGETVLSGEELDTYFQEQTGLDISVEDAYEIYTKEKKTARHRKILARIKHFAGTENPFMFRFPDRIKYYQERYNITATLPSQ